jgi:sulfoxide reductase catalytic subunit YedY
MANVIIRPEWHLAEKWVTPESFFINRRSFLRQLGFTGSALLAGSMVGCGQAQETRPASAPSASGKYPAKRNSQFDPGWRLTNEKVAGTYNNFYEFSPSDKEIVHKLAVRLVTSPWPIQISGLIEKPMTIDAAELVEQFPLEERVYRFRCVEAWAMIVPWTGFPLSKLIEKVSPKPEAKFIRFETFNRPDQAPAMKQRSYPWPYFEGLRMDEAMHPLTMLVTGVYGKPLPNQHGAPVRLIVPWKYGYKSIKSIVKIEFVREQPKTFWETLAPDEYPFESNVNPKEPHPRWSQAFERIIDTGDRVRTQPYNGYGESVAKLYAL